MTEGAARPRAVIIGAGIGGLAAAAGLHAAGWDVTAYERAASLEPVGAGLALAPNGLRALDVFGAGDAVRAHAIGQEIGIRRPDGRWLLRSSTERMVTDRFGDPVILLPRSRLIEALASRVPAGVLALSTEVTSAGQDGHVVTAAGPLDADLVVAADGLSSATRAALFPDASRAPLRGVHHVAAADPGVPWAGADVGDLGTRQRVRRHAAGRRPGVLLRRRARAAGRAQP